MKKVLLLIWVFVFAIDLTALAQYDPSYKHKDRRAALFAEKIATYTKMKKVGVGLGLAGGVLSISGALLVSSADWETTTGYNGTTNKTTTDSEGVTGLLMLVVGIPLAATGIVLGSIGSHKVKSYQQKLDRLSVKVDYGWHNRGLVLTYRF